MVLTWEFGHLEKAIKNQRDKIFLRKLIVVHGLQIIAVKIQSTPSERSLYWLFQSLS